MVITTREFIACFQFLLTASEKSFLIYTSTSSELLQDFFFVVPIFFFLPRSLDLLQIIKHSACLPEFWLAMDTKIKLRLMLDILLLCLFWKTRFSLTADTISIDDVLSENSTLVSAGGIFEMGFFQPGRTPNY